MEVLKAEGIRKSFRGDLSLARREVLHGVTLEAWGEEILGFLGPNGSGKTTTIKIILGLIRPDSGDVTIFGRPVGDRSAMARIGYLPEKPFFYPHLSLTEFLRFCGQMSGMGGKSLSSRIHEVAEAVGLGTNGDVRLKNFSKGMLQRAGLAQAILHDPDLLILDEPFSGLDPLGRIMVRDLLIDLRKRKKTIFFSSHILPDVETLCDRTCIIREGLIVRYIGLDELLRIGKGKVEVTARGCRLDGTEALWDYVESSNEVGEEICLVVKEQELVRPVVQYLYNLGAEILKVANKHPSLEEIFMDEVTKGTGDHRHAKREKEITLA
ncbi:MAG: ABC transporter ATP-binding protein [Candidatus Krumholzibacteria bacterium]|nr:ABC transporter ATP-binding protein [Candidatus Krumholzibacteria bacterium]